MKPRFSKVQCDLLFGSFQNFTAPIMWLEVATHHSLPYALAAKQAATQPANTNVYSNKPLMRIESLEGNNTDEQRKNERRLGNVGKGYQRLASRAPKLL